MSGPRKLNTVGTPSSLRTGPTKRMAGWKRWAKQNPMPASATQRATPSGPSSIATPSASSTSAVPTDDDAARLPCLQTGTPAPAVMKAASVVTLMLDNRSPPVPTRSTAASASPSARGQGTAASTMARARPVTSSAVSPLACSRDRNAPSWAGVASPERTILSVSSASAALSVLPPAQPGQDLGPGQSHHRSLSSTPRAMRPSCTCEVPSTMVSCLASRYHCSVGWSSM